MRTGSLAVVEQWQHAVNAPDPERVQALCAEQVEVAGPRGTATGRAALAEWLARAGFRAEPTRWFCGADGAVVVEQRARWTSPDGTSSAAMVASQYAVRDGEITRYARHPDLPAALEAAGLRAADEVRSRDGDEPGI